MLNTNVVAHSSGPVSLQSQKSQLQQQAPSAPYVTSSGKETPPKNYMFVIETSVIEW
jgi:hypothetical protein